MDASGTIQALTRGSETLIFFYDSTGRREGFSYYVGDSLVDNCYYLYNAQGDVTDIVNDGLNILVSYKYDSWGKVLECSGAAAEILGELNPFRYRGYVYDSETGFYYLNSRYYDPETGRFINADSVIADVGGDLRGYNLFVYCFNNPVNMSDALGNWPKFVEELGSRLNHAVDIMGRIAIAPLKAITVEVGAGVGMGAQVSANVGGIPIEAGIINTVTDSIVYDKGIFDIQNKSIINVNINLAEVFDYSYTKGHGHSYFDENCTCNFMKSTFGDKSKCEANQKISSSNATFGFSLGAYFLFGFDVTVAVDMAAWNDELITIYFDSLTYGR